MAGVNGSNDLHVRVLSRRLVKASDSSIKPHVLAVSNLDLIPLTIQTSMFCIYPRPPTGDFNAVVETFEAGLPSFLNHFFPFAGRIATNPGSGLPEFHCNNQGAELVVGEAAVALASLDYGTMTASVRRVQQPYGQDMALSVQLVSFACGGFAVAWCTNHVLVDGSALSMLVSAWSELARSGTLSAASRPNHDRSVFRPRAAPAYSASLNKAFTPLDAERQVNVLTAEQSSVERLYYIEASDVARLREAASRGGGGERATRFRAVSAYLWKALAGVVGAADARCRMQWWVDGRRRLTEPPELRAAMRSYVGNVTTSVIREAGVDDVRRMALPDVAAMVGEATAAPAYDEHFQELVDWVEEHKADRYVETASLGLGSPTLSVTAFTSFPVDTDFGLGHAAMAMPTASPTARLCSGYVQITARPDGDGSWIASAFVWPRLAAALESDEPCVFKPVTAEYLGLLAP
ncbi:omega-hydroxypalmitate O-feruloyl transferase-like [Panicum miliaceum]|uniref:Omega-hydroxypalmitate O-feruloyl transferase-like n=1 Tax=Panicum miliaceum TaxID=4540 RepID=A0A3L6SSB0_PANMI|nr:omega-hydroxypalmitate O-feruloyl transferase-like [Panicum miliaceum]